MHTVTEQFIEFTNMFVRNGHARRQQNAVIAHVVKRIIMVEHTHKTMDKLGKKLGTS